MTVLVVGDIATDFGCIVTLLLPLIVMIRIGWLRGWER